MISPPTDKLLLLVLNVNPPSACTCSELPVPLTRATFLLPDPDGPVTATLIAEPALPLILPVIPLVQLIAVTVNVLPLNCNPELDVVWLVAVL